MSSINTAIPTRKGAQISATPEAKTTTAKPKEADHKASGLRPQEGPPEYEKYRYGYPMTPGRIFGSGN